MSTKDIRDLRDAEPFQPFDILLRSGRALHVDWKDAVSFTPSGRHVVVDVGSAFTFVDVPDVAELKVRPRRFPGASRS